MRLLVAGGRDYRDHGYVAAVLDALHAAQPITVLIHGNARGADSLAHHWALVNHIRPAPFPARWNLDGPGAGPIRNARMLREGRPDLAVCFPGGRGTADMKRQCLRAGVIALTVPSK